MKLVKSCACCGREIEWRRKWRECWEEIRFCSTDCRRNKPGPVDRKIEASILELLGSRASGSSICPSEIARAIFTTGEWREQMERTRRAARRLASTGTIEITQGGHRVDPSKARGPIRLRRGPDFP